jgi:hypothetical protein
LAVTSRALAARWAVSNHLKLAFSVSTASVSSSSGANEVLKSRFALACRAFAMLASLAKARRRFTSDDFDRLTCAHNPATPGMQSFK